MCLSTTRGFETSANAKPPAGSLGIYIVISDVGAGHTLVDIVVADPTRRDLVERAARHDLVAAMIRSEGRKPTIGIA